MRIPAITGIIRRRILLNYRVVPEAIQSILPGNFRPKPVGEYAIAGICLIRLEKIRPKGLPPVIGISSENSAHRIAVEWDDNDGSHEGVYVPRRDTDSRLNALTGGRIFPGIHHLSRFTVCDANHTISLRVDTEDEEAPLLDLKVRTSDSLPSGSIFNTLQESSDFFESGCVGYSPRPHSSNLDGLMLKIRGWEVSPLSVGFVKSAYFDDTDNFPAGSICFDHALLMRDIVHEWHTQPSINCLKTPQPEHAEIP